MADDTTAPDPKTVREIAQDALIVAVRRGATEAVEAALIAHGGGGPVVGEKFDVYTNAVAAEYARMAAALARPDEQQPADVVTAEQQQDGAVGREAVDVVRAWVEGARFDEELIELEAQTLRAALAEHDALATRVAELESERDDDLCILAAFLLPNRRPIEHWLAILANHFEARTNALMRDADRFAAARFRVDRVPTATETEES